MQFRPDPRAEEGIRKQPVFRAAMAENAKTVAAVIRFVALPYRNTGYFIQHIEERETDSRNLIWFLDPFWHLSEFGSVSNPPQRNALRGVRAAGLRYEDAGAKQAE